jgi:hypothetical protein
VPHLRLEVDEGFARRLEDARVLDALRLEAMDGILELALGR